MGLRYGVQKRCLADFGIDVTCRVLAEIDAAMQREGFEPGAAGKASRSDWRLSYLCLRGLPVGNVGVVDFNLR